MMNYNALKRLGTKMKLESARLSIDIRGIYVPCHVVFPAGKADRPIAYFPIYTDDAGDAAMAASILITSQKEDATQVVRGPMPGGIISGSCISRRPC